MIDLTYTLTRRDMIAGLGRIYPWDYMNPIIKLGAYVVLIGGFIAFTAEVAIDVLVLSIPALLFLAWIALPYLRFEVPEGARTLRISQQGVAVGGTLRRWKTFERFIEAGNHYVLVASKGEKDYLIIPKRAFASPEQMTAFRVMARRAI